MDKILNKIDLTIYRASPNVFLILVFLGIFAFFSLKKIKPKYKTAFMIILIVFTVYFALPDKKYKTNNLETFFLDVGQGDAEVIVFPNGKSLLIDGGGVYYSSFEVGKRIVLPFLLQKKIKIDWIAVSHTHPDHVRGVLEIIKILKPSELWLSQKSVKDRYWKALINKSKGLTKILYIDSTFKRYVGKCKIECIYPQRVINERYANNNSSQVLKISDKFHSFLFTGDIEKKAEYLLINSMGKKLKSDVLKVPHHGSKTSSSIKFLQFVYPKIAVFSSKKNNKFGFPHTLVIKNYKKIKTKNLFTAKNGGIRIVSKSNNLYIEKGKLR
jgi:competence protein ComEC